MRYILIIIFVLIVSSLSYGYFIREADPVTGEFYIGISIVGLFFIWMPLFIYHRWRNKSVKDYMLTKENIEKMRDESKDKKM